MFLLFLTGDTCIVQGGGVPIDDEEDVDEDTNEDFVDPWGIVYKPLKVTFKKLISLEN